MEYRDLKISELKVATQLDGREIIPFAKDDANGSLLVSLLKTYIRDGLATQEAVAGKQSKLTPGYGIEIAADNTIKSTLDVSLFKVVTSLPTTNIENKIYLILDSESSSQGNTYIEYLYVNGKWEIIGKYTATINLDPYLKSAESEQQYAKKTQIPDVSNFVTNTQLNQLIEHVATLETKMVTATNKLATIPAMPENDHSAYAIIDGQWSEIASANEAVVTVTNSAATNNE